MALAAALRAGLERLSERCPTAPSSSSLCAAVFTPVPGSLHPAPNGGRAGRSRWLVKKKASEAALLGAAGGLLLDPRFCVAAGGCLRPVALHALDHGLDHLRAAATSRSAAAAGRSAADAGKKNKASPAAPTGPVAIAAAAENSTAAMTSAVEHERACAALGMLLELLPHATPIAMRYLRATPPPFARLVATGGGGSGGGGGGSGGKISGGAKAKETPFRAGDDAAAAGTERQSGDGDTRDHALLVVRACVRLLRAVGGGLVGGTGISGSATGGAGEGDAGASSSPSCAWDCTPLIRFLRHPDPEIRWTVAMALERTLGLPCEAASTLRAQQVKPELELESHLCTLDPETRNSKP